MSDLIYDPVDTLEEGATHLLRDSPYRDALLSSGRRTVEFIGGKYLVASSSAKVGQLSLGVVLPELLAPPDDIALWRGVGFNIGSWVRFWSAYIGTHWKSNYHPVIEERGIIAGMKAMGQDFVAIETAMVPIIMLGGTTYAALSEVIPSGLSYVATTLAITVAGGRWNRFYRESQAEGGVIRRLIEITKDKTGFWS
jgi:hypothetical protein